MMGFNGMVHKREGEGNQMEAIPKGKIIGTDFWPVIRKEE